MDSNCYNNWMLHLYQKISDLGVKVANAQAYNTNKQKCLFETLIMATFIFDVIQCFCFYTEAELLADTTLTGGDKSESVTDEEIKIILNKLKTILNGECNC